MFNDGEKEKQTGRAWRWGKEKSVGEKGRGRLLRGWEGLGFDLKKVPTPSYWESRKATSLSKPYSDLKVTSQGTVEDKVRPFRRPNHVNPWPQPDCLMITSCSLSSLRANHHLWRRTSVTFACPAVMKQVPGKEEKLQIHPQRYVFASFSIKILFWYSKFDLNVTNNHQVTKQSPGHRTWVCTGLGGRWHDHGNSRNLVQSGILARLLDKINMFPCYGPWHWPLIIRSGGDFSSDSLMSKAGYIFSSSISTLKKKIV